MIQFCGGDYGGARGHSGGVGGRDGGELGPPDVWLRVVERGGGVDPPPEGGVLGPGRGRDVPVGEVSRLGLESVVGGVGPGIGGCGEAPHSGNTATTATSPPSSTVLEQKLETKTLTGLQLYAKPSPN